MNGQYQWYLGNLRDGKITTQVPLYDTSWALVMDDAGTLSGTASLADDDVRALNFHDNAAIAKAFLAVSYTGVDGVEVFLEAGPIWSWNYTPISPDGSGRELQLGAAGLWSYYDHRKVMPVLAPTDNPAVVTSEFDNLSMGTVASRLVNLAATHTGGNLPVVLPSDEAGVFDAIYPGYELDDIGTILRALTQLSGGPEIRFRPQRNPTAPTFLQWILEVGTTEDPFLHQIGDDHYWDATVPRGSVAGISVNADGTAMGGLAWVKGSGDAEGSIIGAAEDDTLTTAGYPLLELDVPGYESEENVAVIDGAAVTALLGGSRPVITLNATVQRDGAPILGSYLIGDYARLNLADHDLLPDGEYLSRLTQISGDDSDMVGVQFAQTLGSISV